MRLFNLERLLDDFPQLKHLELSVTCDAEWFEERRRVLGPERKFWTLIHRSSDFKTQYKHLKVTENLYISCDLSEPMYTSDDDSNSSDSDSDDTASDTSSDASETPLEKVIFKATESNTPYAWQGLELEQISD